MATMNGRCKKAETRRNDDDWSGPVGEAVGDFGATDKGSTCRYEQGHANHEIVMLVGKGHGQVMIQN